MHGYVLVFTPIGPLTIARMAITLPCTYPGWMASVIQAESTAGYKAAVKNCLRLSSSDTGWRLQASMLSIVAFLGRNCMHGEPFLR